MGTGCWYTTPLAVSVHNFEADRRRFIHTESMLVRSNIQRSLVLCVFFYVYRLFYFLRRWVALPKQRYKQMSRPEKCPCCGSPVVLRSADGIYKSNPNHARLYVCSKYPACDTYVRVIPNTTIPLGTMADKKLRYLRKQAHFYFDQLHLTGIMSKKQAYAWLADVLQLPPEKVHIGYFGDYYCQQVIQQARKVLQENQYRFVSGGI